MIVTATAAAISTALTASWISDLFTGPVTLTLPLEGAQQGPARLGLDSSGTFSQMEATIPALPHSEASMLAWSAVLNQTGVLAVAALLFLLALRLRGANLFTAGSAWIIGSCGTTLALSGSAAQILGDTALTRLSLLIGATPQRPGKTSSSRLPSMLSQWSPAWRSCSSHWLSGSAAGSRKTPRA